MFINPTDHPSSGLEVINVFYAIFGHDIGCEGMTNPEFFRVRDRQPGHLFYLIIEILSKGPEFKSGFWYFTNLQFFIIQFFFFIEKK